MRRGYGRMIVLVLAVVLGAALPVGACSSFAAYSDEVIYGSNMDWNETSIARFSLQQGTGEIRYFLSEYKLFGVYRGTMGMNNQGLLVTVQSVPPINTDQLPTDGAQKYIIDVFDWALQNASTTQEVEQYILDKSIFPVPGFFLHMHVADQGGRAVIIEVSPDGKKVTKVADNFSAMTNFYNYQYPDGTEQCPRYQIAYEELEQNYDQMNPERAFQLLAKLRQFTTRVTLVYLPERQQIQMALGGDFSKVWLIDLEKATLQRYQGFEEEKTYPLTATGVTSDELGFNFLRTIKSETTYSLEPEQYQDYEGLYFFRNGLRAKVLVKDQMLFLELTT